jgi:fucose permease
MRTNKQSLFVMPDGKNVMITFILVSSLFLLWGVCNGMIDVMDKHFQDELGLSKSQSAWVQFAHYLGYFLMALPAGWLAIRLGYKGGIITGLLLVAVGGFWFIPATKINAMVHTGAVSPTMAFVAYLIGVCAIAAGLTFLETIANPYTTVLGPTRYAATRINLAQSCNGIGWIFGPIIGGMFFYTKDAATGRSMGSETLYIPYVIVGVVVCLLAVVFYFAYIPDVKTEDDYHLDDATPNVSHSIWKHPHFALAVLAQFLYVAAQAGIFSFFINYMTSEVPSIPAAWRTGRATEWIDVQTTFVGSDFKDLPAFAAKLKQKSDPVSAFLSSELSTNTVASLAEYKEGTPVPKPLRLALIQDLNHIVKQDPTRVKSERLLYSPERFSGITLGAKTVKTIGDKTQQAQMQQDMTRLLAQLKQEVAQRLDHAPLEDKAQQAKIQEKFELKMSRLLDALPKKEVNLAQFNRNLLLDAYPNEISFNDSILAVSDKGAAFLASVGFFCFLIGRFTGAGLLKKLSAHKILGLYGVMNVITCLLVFSKLGWLSVACVFLSYFFMSIMFPTIFALGIFGLGARAKKASAFIVMAIMGGAILPKLMGYVADQYDMSRGFIVPMACFAFVAFYGYSWPKLAKAESLNASPAVGGH